MGTFSLAGQSYGGMLAQAYLAYRPEAVERLILSSTGPTDYGRGWLPVEYAIIALVRLLPEKTVKNLLTGGLLKAVTLPEDRRAEWVGAIQAIMDQEITRADAVSHFAVAADLIRKRWIAPAAFRDWPGNIFVLHADNDITQSEKDFPVTSGCTAGPGDRYGKHGPYRRHVRSRAVCGTAGTGACLLLMNINQQNR